MKNPEYEKSSAERSKEENDESGYSEKQMDLNMEKGIKSSQNVQKFTVFQKGSKTKFQRKV